MNTTEQNNILLAEFLDMLTTDSEGNIKEDLNSLNFQTNWNLLMQVIRKIERLDFEFQITSKHVTVLTNHSAIY